MARYRNLINSVTDLAGSVMPIKMLVKISGRKLLVPLYHAVSNEKPVHTRHIYKTKDIKQFISDLEYLTKYYKPVDLAQLILMHNYGQKITTPCFHLTFDDGLSEFYHTVAPVLLSKGIPATCFLNPAFINNTTIFYRHKAGLIIDSLRQRKDDPKFWKAYHKWIEEKGLRNRHYQKIIADIGFDSRVLLDELLNMAGVSVDDYLRDHSPYLSENQVSELINKGFTFGGHSIDHPDFRYIPEEEQVFQARESVRQIREKFGLNYGVFSFPFTDHGISARFFEKVHDQAGIDLVFGCSGLKKDPQGHTVQRIPMEEYNPNGKQRIKSEYLYYIIKAPLGKNSIQR